MHISHCWTCLVLAGLFFGISADWEVLNEVSVAEVDGLDFTEEHFLPVDAAPKRNNKAKQRSLSSVDQSVQENTKQKPEHKPEQTTQTSTNAVNKESIKVKQTQDSNHGSQSQKIEPSKSDATIDLASEELLSVENTNSQHSPNSRKLAQFKEDVIGMSPKKEKSQGNTEDKIDMDSLSFQVACVYENSWECMMFKQDFLAMQGDTNLSRRLSAHERAKRQSSSNFRQPEPFKNSANMRNLLGCENNDCLSGGNDTDILDEAPQFRYKSKTRTKTNLTSANLTDDVRQKLADELQQQLTDVFGNIPGFVGVTVDPKKIYIDGDGNLVYDDWVVTIDGGNSTYTGANGTTVDNIMKDALANATDKMKNIQVNGESPLDPFNSTDFADTIAQQANDPCNMNPSPCKMGYGRCKELAPDYVRMTGIRVQCMDNCYEFSNCSRQGECEKDISGNAYCSCNPGRIGLYCDKINGTGANQDIGWVPIFTLNMTATFPTSLTNSDLTPEKRKQLAQQLKDQLAALMGNFPGFVGITIDPNAITIVDGKLIIPWGLQFDPSNAAFSGKTPDQIGDVVRGYLEGVSDTYRKNVTVDGQTPYDDLDFNNAADQAEELAMFPCLENPCPMGYGNCEAVNASLVKCIHNCNARPGQCQNGGKCQLDNIGRAICQCPSSWEGDTCSEKSKELDGGQIAGIVLGCALVALGLIGSCCWFLLCARRNKNIDFTNYTDEDGSGRSSSPPASDFVIDRPTISYPGMAVYNSHSHPGSNAGQFSRPTSAGNSSAGSVRGNPSNPFAYSQA